MFDQFSGPPLPLEEGLWVPKESQFDRKSLFSTDVALYLVPKPQVNTKTDLSECNEQSVSCLTIHQNWP